MWVILVDIKYVAAKVWKQDGVDHLLRLVPLYIAYGSLKVYDYGWLEIDCGIYIYKSSFSFYARWNH